MPTLARTSGPVTGCPTAPAAQTFWVVGSSGFLCFSLASPSKIRQGCAYPRNSDLTPDALSGGSPLAWKIGPASLGRTVLPAPAPGPLARFPLPANRAELREGGRQEGCQQGVVTVYKQKVAPSCPPQRTVLPRWLRKSGSCRESPQNAPPVLWPRTKGLPRGHQGTA